MKIIKQSYIVYNDFWDYEWCKYYPYSESNWQKVIEVAKTYSIYEIESDSIFYERSDDSGMQFNIIKLEDCFEID